MCSLIKNKLILIVVSLFFVFCFSACPELVTVDPTQPDSTEDQGSVSADNDSHAEENTTSTNEEDDSATTSSENSMPVIPDFDPVVTEEETSCSFDLSIMTGTEIGDNLVSAYEPSGAVWHERLQKLFIVSDSGYVSRLNADGINVTNWYLSGDFEGITVADTSSNYVYVGVENPDKIIEFDYVNGYVTRNFYLTTWMTGVANQGLEALTFVPDTHSVEGGYFLAGHQGEGKVYIFELPLKSDVTSQNVTFINSFYPLEGTTDLSGLHFDREAQLLYVIYDSSNLMVTHDLDAGVTTTQTLPGDNQEGIAMNPDCDLFITEDDGNVMRY